LRTFMHFLRMTLCSDISMRQNMAMDGLQNPGGQMLNPLPVPILPSLALT